MAEAAAAEKMPTRPMGSQGMQCSMQGYGAMGIASFYGKPLPMPDAVALLKKAYELGVTHYDSAELYTGKDDEGNTVYSEEMVGRFAAEVGKDNVTIATKYFPGGDKAACTPEMVRESLSASLARLGMDCVDLYYLHRVPSDDALRSFMETAKELVSEGKCKYIGVSEATPDQIRLAHAIHPLTAVQQEWSMLIRNLEADVVPTCRELGIGIVAYSPMCRGFTSALVKSPEDWNKIGYEGGAATGFQTTCPHLAAENVSRNAQLLAPLEEKAAELSVTPAQLSLAWVHAQGPDVFPIPGTTKEANLISNVQAATIALSTPPAVFEELGRGVDYAKVEGERYAPEVMAMSYEKK